MHQLNPVVPAGPTEERIFSTVFLKLPTTTTSSSNEISWFLCRWWLGHWQLLTKIWLFYHSTWEELISRTLFRPNASCCLSKEEGQTVCPVLFLKKAVLLCLQSLSYIPLKEYVTWGEKRENYFFPGEQLLSRERHFMSHKIEWQWLSSELGNQKGADKMFVGIKGQPWELAVTLRCLTPRLSWGAFFFFFKESY